MTQPAADGGQGLAGVLVMKAAITDREGFDQMRVEHAESACSTLRRSVAEELSNCSRGFTQWISNWPPVDGQAFSNDGAAGTKTMAAVVRTAAYPLRPSHEVHPDGQRACAVSPAAGLAVYPESVRVHNGVLARRACSRLSQTTCHIQTHARPLVSLQPLHETAVLSPSIHTRARQDGVVHRVTDARAVRLRSSVSNCRSGGQGQFANSAAQE